MSPAGSALLQALSIFGRPFNGLWGCAGAAISNRCHLPWAGGKIGIVVVVGGETIIAPAEGGATGIACTVGAVVAIGVVVDAVDDVPAMGGEITIGPGP